MLSYQHGYHAGSFADIVKHFVLSRMISYMIKKEKPLLYLETHSGSGSYDLASKESLKTLEAEVGIKVLWNNKVSIPPLFDSYIQSIQALNKDNECRYYPGSPQIAIDMLRPQDRLAFSELHPKEFRNLEKLPKKNKKVFFYQQDGIQSLNAMLPPSEHRGLIFIDPSFEIKTDYTEIPKAIKEAYRRFSQGTYCLWYPIINTYTHEKLLQGLHKIPSEDILRLEFYFAPKAEQGMKGSGLFIINPPYVLKEEAKTAFQYLTQCKEGSFYLIKEGKT